MKKSKLLIIAASSILAITPTCLIGCGGQTEQESLEKTILAKVNSDEYRIYNVPPISGYSYYCSEFDKQNNLVEVNGYATYERENVKNHAYVSLTYMYNSQEVKIDNAVSVLPKVQQIVENNDLYSINFVSVGTTNNLNHCLMETINNRFSDLRVWDVKIYKIDKFKVNEKTKQVEFEVFSTIQEGKKTEKMDYVYLPDANGNLHLTWNPTTETTTEIYKAKHKITINLTDEQLSEVKANKGRAFEIFEQLVSNNNKSSYLVEEVEDANVNNEIKA